MNEEVHEMEKTRLSLFTEEEELQKSWAFTARQLEAEPLDEFYLM